MATVNIRVDDALKRDTEGILSALGLSMTTATTLFYRQIVRYGGIPLELKVDQPNPNKETLEALQESKKMIADGSARNFSSLAEMRRAMLEENQNYF